MLSDIEIAQQAQMEPIVEIAKRCNLAEDELELYGTYKATVSFDAMERLQDTPNGKLVLVTAITPTPAGEGKSTTTIGLTQALQQIGVNSIAVLREPSLGPVFGVKGGAALRNVVIGMGGPMSGVPREDHFMITVASEIMAILCLARDLEDLKARFGRIVIGTNLSGDPVFVHQLGCEGAMALLMKDAIKPNLVQTLEHTPVLIHGGPFANIAHGCNSIIATKLGLKLGDVVITEAGFGADLGAEKFLHIKCHYGDIFPDAVVIVATIRALKMHGGVPKSELTKENVKALERGFVNLGKQIANMRAFGLPVLVSINKFATDTPAEIDALLQLCDHYGVDVSLNECWEKGGAGGIDMAKQVMGMLEGTDIKPTALYDVKDSIPNKLTAIVKEIYGGNGVEFTSAAKKQIAQLEAWGLADLPVCVAKTQYSLSDNPELLGAPTDFTITVQDVRIANGAGFIVCQTSNIMVMPGLPKQPAALGMDVTAEGTIKGLF